MCGIPWYGKFFVELSLNCTSPGVQRKLVKDGRDKVWPVIHVAYLGETIANQERRPPAVMEKF